MEPIMLQGKDLCLGIPISTYRALPKQVRKALQEGKLYTSNMIEEIITTQFTSQTIQDIAVLYVEDWKPKFHEREQFSQNLSEFYVRELAKHTNISERSYSDVWSGFDSLSWEYSGYKLNGYNAAIEGKNDSVIQLLFDFANPTEHFSLHMKMPLTASEVETAKFLKLEQACKKLRLFGEGYGHAMFANYVRAVQSDHLTTNEFSKKLKWLGSPAQFGFIVQELIGKGYLEKPSGSYAKDAKLYLQIFEMQTTPSTLAKEISPNESQNSLSTGNRTKFSIPYIEKL